MHPQASQIGTQLPTLTQAQQQSQIVVVEKYVDAFLKSRFKNYKKTYKKHSYETEAGHYGLPD